MHSSIKAEHKHSTVVENDVRGSNLEDCVQHYVSSRQNDYYSIAVSGFYESWVKTQHGFAHRVPLVNYANFGSRKKLCIWKTVHHDFGKNQ